MRRDDPDAAALRRRVIGKRLHNARQLAQRLQHERGLKAPWTVGTATDMLVALISSDMIWP